MRRRGRGSRWARLTCCTIRVLVWGKPPQSVVINGGGCLSRSLHQMSERFSQELQEDFHQVEKRAELFNEAPVINAHTIKHYIVTRLPTLFDLPVLKSDRRWYEILNPVPGLKSMTAQHWNFYMLGWLAWVVDSLDFFCVSASATEIAHTLQVDITEITWGITLVLMLRTVGALIFGTLADTYGRKKPYIAICALFIVVEIGTGFVKTKTQFLGVRALFGVLMGAMYPVALVTALENQPKDAKSIASGLFLPGYNMGYILATVFYRAFENTTFSGRHGEGWRNLFFFSAGLPVILIVWRLFVEESPAYVKLAKVKEKVKVQRAQDLADGKLSKKEVLMERLHIDHTLINCLKTDWLTILLLIVVMSLFNFISHGTQDLYTTFLVLQRKVTQDQRTYAVVIVNLGAVFGGIFFGQLTELLGRRLTIIICLVWSGAFLYPAFMLELLGALIPTGFLLQFGVMGAWGVAPLYIMELANHTHRALITGVCYQLGNLASSASSTIESTLGEKFPLPQGGYDYGKVMAIFCGAIFITMIIVIVFAYERFHHDLVVKTDDVSTIHYDEESILSLPEEKEKHVVAEVSRS